MTTRVIAPDLDGTLLTSKTILPASLEALARAREAGYQVIVVTGRHHVAIHPFIRHWLSIHLQFVVMAPICMIITQKVLAADPMPVEQAVSLTAMLAKQQIHGLAYVDDAMLYEHPTGHVIRTRNWAQALPEDQRPVFAQVDSLAQAVREVNAVWKFALTDDDIPRLQRFAQQVGETLGLECEWSWHDQVDIARAGNSKGKRPAQWVADQGLSMQDVVAFGDNYNDLSMLEAAGTGVAMGNAVDEVKARANIVIGDNESTSIAEFIYRQLL